MFFLHLLYNADSIITWYRQVSLYPCEEEIYARAAGTDHEMTSLRSHFGIILQEPWGPSAFCSGSIRANAGSGYVRSRFQILTVTAVKAECIKQICLLRQRISQSITLTRIQVPLGRKHHMSGTWRWRPDVFQIDIYQSVFSLPAGTWLLAEPTGLAHLDPAISTRVGSWSLCKCTLTLNRKEAVWRETEMRKTGQIPQTTESQALQPGALLFLLMNLYNYMILTVGITLYAIIYSIALCHNTLF